jgi:alanyl-tRNA synthetase
MALFGEKYAETVRTITIGGDSPFSYELCGGTHVSETGDIGVFLITSESSIGAGLRRIEAVTGRGAYELIRRRFQMLEKTAAMLETSPEMVAEKAKSLSEQLERARKQIDGLRQEIASQEFNRILEGVDVDGGVPVMVAKLEEADADTLRRFADRFRQRYPSGVALLASTSGGQPLLVAAVSEDLVERGLHAGELVKHVSQPLGGSGGGRPTLAQAGGKDASRLDEALESAHPWILERLRG